MDKKLYSWSMTWSRVLIWHDLEYLCCSEEIYIYIYIHIYINIYIYMPLGLRPFDRRRFNFIMSFDLHLLWGWPKFWLALQSSALKFAMATPFLRVDFSFSYLGKRNMALSTALLPRNSYLTVKHGCTSLFFTYMTCIYIYCIFVILHCKKWLPDIYISYPLFLHQTSRPVSKKNRAVSRSWLLQCWWKSGGLPGCREPRTGWLVNGRFGFHFWNLQKCGVSGWEGWTNL